MTAARVLETLSMPLLVNRRCRGLARRRSHLDHIARVLAARPAFLARHDGQVPRWVPCCPLRTVRHG